MLARGTVAIIILLFVASLASVGFAATEKERINEFYGKLVETLKAPDTQARDLMELVQRNHSIAEKLFVVLDEKVKAAPQAGGVLEKLHEKLEQGLLLAERRCKEDVSNKLVEKARSQADLTLDDRIFFVKTVTERCRRDAAAFQFLGELYLRQLQYGMAIEAFQRKQRLQPDEDTERLIELAKQKFDEFKNRSSVSAEEVRALMKDPPSLMAPVPGKLASRFLMKRALQTKVHFDTNSSEIKDEFKGVLDVVGKEVKEAFGNDSNLGLLIEGHTDARGSERMNFELSQQRAASIKQYLVEKFGLDPAKIQTKGYGFFRLLDPGQDPESHALNRRVEFKKQRL